MAERDAANRRADRAFETLRAIAVDGLGLPDPWAENASETIPPEWGAPLMSQEVAKLRKQRDAARMDADARLKQLLNQEDINRRAISEWEQALIKSADLLRPFVRMEFNSMSGEDTIINGAKQSDFDAAKVFLDGFDSRRKETLMPQNEENLAAIIDELTAFAKWIRSPAVNRDDARDDMARALENRVRYLQTRIGSHRVSQCLGCEVRDSDLYALMQRCDSILGREIEERRKEQDAQHGGQVNDDTLGIDHWLQFIRNHLFRIDPYYRHQDNENNLLDIAALAVAAIQSSRRKRETH